MASEVVAVAALSLDSAFVECSIIRHLAMLLVGWGSLTAEGTLAWALYRLCWFATETVCRL
jgi:hypothetical protein